MLRYELSKVTEAITWWIAFHLPRKVVLFCAIRVWANATSGPYGHTHAPSVTIDESIKRWEGKVGGDRTSLSSLSSARAD